MKSTTRFSKNKRGIICLNCGQPISDNDHFCSNCGQVNDELPLSIKQFVSEFFSGFFSFDTRFFKTFFPLLFKPGKVSKEYIEGKRRRYVNPFQLYLHVTIVFFLLQGLFSALDEYKISGSFTKKEKLAVTDSISKVTDSIIKKTKGTLKDVKDDLAAQGIDIDVPDIPDISVNDSVNKINTDSILKKYNIPYTRKSKIDTSVQKVFEKTKHRIDSIFNTSQILEQLGNKTLTDIQKDSIFDKFYESNMIFITKILDGNDIESWKQIQNISKVKELSINYIERTLISKKINFKLKDKYKTSIEDEMILNMVGKSMFKKVSDFMAYDKEHKDISILEALETLGYDRTRWNIFYYKKAQDFNKFKEDSEFRSSYLDNIISKISIALFFMLPIFTAFLSLIYIRGKKNYTEHLVLVFNVQTSFFIFLIFFTIFNRVFKTDIGIGLFFLVFLFYLYKSLRNFYKQNRFKTIIKYFILNTIFVTLSIIGFVIISFLAFVL